MGGAKNGRGELAAFMLSILLTISHFDSREERVARGSRWSKMSSLFTLLVITHTSRKHLSYVAMLEWSNQWMPCVLQWVVSHSFWTVNAVSFVTVIDGIVSLGLSRSLSNTLRNRKLKYTNPARGILDFCKQKFYQPLQWSQWIT